MGHVWSGARVVWVSGHVPPPPHTHTLSPPRSHAPGRANTVSVDNLDVSDGTKPPNHNPDRVHLICAVRTRGHVWTVLVVVMLLPVLLAACWSEPGPGPDPDADADAAACLPVCCLLCAVCLSLLLLLLLRPTTLHSWESETMCWKCSKDCSKLQAGCVYACTRLHQRVVAPALPVSPVPCLSHATPAVRGCQLSPCDPCDTGVGPGGWPSRAHGRGERRRDGDTFTGRVCQGQRPGQ